MARSRSEVASGVIGQFDIPWEVHRIRDMKTEEEYYELDIDDAFFCNYNFILDALAVLVSQFS